MATSGTLYSSTYCSRSIKFYWWLSAQNVDARTGTISWYVETSASDNMYYLVNKTQDLYINGGQVMSLASTYTRSSGATVYRGLVTPGKYLDGREYYDTNGDYTGVKRWVYGLGTKWYSGSFNFSYDDNGNYSFTVEGMFHWYSSSSNQALNNTTQYLDQIEVNSKIYKTGNAGSNWDKSYYVYKTDNYGSSWYKINLYKTTDSGSNWNKVK